MNDLTIEIKKLEIETLDNLKLSKAKKPLLFNNLKQIIKVINDSSASEFKKLRDKSLILVVKSFIISDNH